MSLSNGDGSGFVHVREVLPEVFKEIDRRSELRMRLEAERGGPVSDEEFLEIAESSSGVKL